MTLDSAIPDGIATTTCSFDCGGRCLLKVHLRNGEIHHISTGNQKGLHLKACPKGLAQHSVVHHPDRLTRPLKRIAERGKGRFAPLSWDEALDLIAGKIQQTIDQSGPEALYFVTNTGSMATLHNTSVVTRRFFDLLGKCTTTWGDPSFEGALQSAMATFGTTATGISSCGLSSPSSPWAVAGRIPGLAPRAWSRCPSKDACDRSTRTASVIT